MSCCGLPFYMTPWWRRHRTRHNKTPPHKPIVFIVFLILLSFCALLFTSTVCSTPSKSPFYLFFKSKNNNFAIPILGICLLLFICRSNLFVTIIFVLHQYEIVIGLNGIQFKAVVRRVFSKSNNFTAQGQFLITTTKLSGKILI